MWTRRQTLNESKWIYFFINYNKAYQYQIYFVCFIFAVSIQTIGILKHQYPLTYDEWQNKRIVLMLNNINNKYNHQHHQFCVTEKLLSLNNGRGRGGKRDREPQMALLYVLVHISKEFFFIYFKCDTLQQTVTIIHRQYFFCSFLYSEK